MATYKVLSAEETRQSGFTHLLNFTFSDFTTETSGAAFEIWPRLSASTTGGAGIMVTNSALYVPTIFVAASMTDLQCIIGDGGDTDRIMATREIGGTTSPITAGTYYEKPSTIPYIYSAADTIDMVLTATGAALSALTAGELYVYLALSDIAKLRTGVI